MKKTSLISIGVTAILLVVVMIVTLISVVNGRDNRPFDPEQEIVLKVEDRQFENINPKIRLAPAYGDRNIGGHGTFGKFPSNFVTPPHTHSAPYHAVVLKGVMTNPFNGEKDPPKMKPGSYWFVPAGSVHTTACVSDTPCEFYMYSDSAFDFNPTEQ